MTIRELGVQLRTRQVSCVELIQQTFASIKERDRFNCFITLIEDAALAEAAMRDEELARGIDRGPFHGIPIGYKDLFYTQGVRTTGGSLLFRDFIPTYDATVVTRLKNAGAIGIGKANLHELAYGITSGNPHFGSVLNPRDPGRLPGGSSGGSAAVVAAGLLPMCLGSDTGGSIRIPASYCGITGLKPTYGRVSRYGVLPLAFSLDHVGPLGSCAEDCALTMDAIAGPDALDETSSQAPVPQFNLDPLADFKQLRIGVPKNFFFARVDKQVAAAIFRALHAMEARGAVAIHIDIPDPESINAAAFVVQLAEAAAIHVNHTDASLFGPDVWARIQQGKLIAGHEYVNAQRIRRLFRREFAVLWSQIDLLIAPTTPITAPLQNQASVQIGGEQEDTRIASTRLVRGINFLGEPALSMPCGQDANGLPIGLQLIGPPFSEPKLLQIAKTLEPMLA
jgi:aspartyl-tRNA(Asn)/glutamyl-tRNA(Gln) amidotransferase subunit A